jgi:hypothetical protein
MNFFTKDDYNELPDLIFPLRMKDDSYLEWIDMECGECGKEVTVSKAKVKDLTLNCCEVIFAGLCQHCQSFQSSKIRYYPKEPRILEFVDGRFIERELSKKYLAPYRIILNFLEYLKTLYAKWRKT